MFQLEQCLSAATDFSNDILCQKHVHAQNNSSSSRTFRRAACGCTERRRAAVAAAAATYQSASGVCSGGWASLCRRLNSAPAGSSHVIAVTTSPPWRHPVDSFIFSKAPLLRAILGFLKPDISLIGHGGAGLERSDGWIWIEPKDNKHHEVF